MKLKYVIFLTTLAFFGSHASFGQDTKTVTVTDLKKQTDAPITKLGISFHNGNDVSTIRSNSQLTCARHQLAEYQKAMDFFAGGRVAVEKAFAANNVSASVFLDDYTASKELPEAKLILNLSDQESFGPGEPHPFYILAKVGINPKTSIAECNYKTANEIADVLLNAKDLTLKAKSGSRASAPSAASVR